ncbi:MAG: uracil-DNA glycosylase family protein [Pseudomonadota bacterium]
MTTDGYQDLLDQIKACRLCQDELPRGPRPVLQAQPSARILVAGQAPGTRVHETGIPFNDPSGDRLRAWMGVDRETFYDDARIAIVPMAFCYPGRGASGDLPPPSRCALAWRSRLLDGLPQLELTLAIGRYALDWHLNSEGSTVTDVVLNWRDAPEGVLPLPHPSPRNNLWLRRNPWFERDLVPELRRRVVTALSN